MSRRSWILVHLALGCLLTGCAGDQPARTSLTVFCGAANRPPMEEIAALFQEQQGVDVQLTCGGSGSLLSRIELTRSGEIYLPASPDYVRMAERRQQIVPDSARTVAYLVPAILTPRGNPAGITQLADLARPGVRVAIGNPETVCLGLFAVELFDHNGLLEPVLANVVTFGASCSKLASLAALSQVDAIVGWRVVHDWNPAQLELVLIAPEQIPRLATVPIAIPVYTRDRRRSQGFIDLVLSPTGQEIYRKHGYLTELEEARRYAPDATVGGEYTLPDDLLDQLRGHGPGR